MKIPEIYRAYIETTPEAPEPVQPKLHEELADLAYQVVKLYAVECNCIQPDITKWWKEHAERAQDLTFKEALERAQTDGECLTRLKEVLSDGPTAKTFLQVQKMGILARIHRQESDGGWQDVRFLRAKVVEEYGEVCQAHPNASFKDLTKAICECLFANSLKATRECLQAITRCAQTHIPRGITLEGMLSFVHLKQLGRIEWNCSGWTSEEVKKHAPPAEQALLAAFQTGPQRQV